MPKYTYHEVMKDILDRTAMGRESYGKYLTDESSEDMLQHLYEELLDAALYIKTEMIKREKAKNV